MAETAGEKRFEAYLTARSLKWSYEKPAGGKQADYTVHFDDGDVVCEVKDFEQGDEDERIRNSGAAVGVDPYPRIREKINASRVQLQPHKGKRPCVLVLYNSGALVSLGSDIIAGAMFGDLGFVLNVGETDSVRGEFIGRARAKMRARQNTTFSAVAVVELFLPHAKLFEELLSERLLKADAFSDAVTDMIQKAFDEIRAERDDIDFDETVARVRVMHNPYASVVLPRTAFSGPYDEHWTPKM